MDIVIDLLKILLPAGAVFAAAYLIVKRFLDNERDQRELANKRQNQSTVTPLRLQAYERIVIFLERINPNALVVRVGRNGLNAQQFQMELIKTIKAEYEHNLSQQIYMSYNAWELVKNAKEEIIKLVNITATKVPHDSPANDLAVAVLNVAGNLGKKLPNDVALEFIKKEVNGIF